MLVKTHQELKAQQDAIFAALRQYKNFYVKFHPETKITGSFIPIYRNIVEKFHSPYTFNQLMLKFIQSIKNNQVIVGYRFAGQFEFVLASGYRMENKGDVRVLEGVHGRRLQSSIEIAKGANPNLHDSTLKQTFILADKIEIILKQKDE